MKYEELGRGVVKRTERRVLGLFIDGTGLDRAARRLNRRVDLTALVKGVSSGLSPVVARYYTLIPYEDDSRQRAFLDAVNRAGLQVIVKRLPPKGITRQVSVDVEMSADILAFAMGHSAFGTLNEYLPEEQRSTKGNGLQKLAQQQVAAPESQTASASEGTSEKTNPTNVRRIVTLVCPSRDLAYPISLSNELGADTITADFGEFAGGDVLKSASKWIDLSGSETIWRE
ncbi:MAG: NYN domain-containing protein [Proteobacteria bacterium]|nr:NYN domain-containing protein [Pseudomonadota bacterium]